MRQVAAINGALVQAAAITDALVQEAAITHRKIIIIVFEMLEACFVNHHVQCMQYGTYTVHGDHPRKFYHQNG